MSSIFTVRRSLVLVWCCTIVALSLMSKGGWYVALGHIPIAGIVFLRRHIRTKANLPKMAPAKKRILMGVIGVMVVLVLVGFGIFMPAIPGARSLFYVLLAILLGNRLFADVKLFLEITMEPDSSKAAS